VSREKVVAKTAAANGAISSGPTDEKTRKPIACVATLQHCRHFAPIPRLVLPQFASGQAQSKEFR